MQLAYILNLNTGVLSLAGSRTPVQSLTIRRNSKTTFSLYLWKDGAPFALPDGWVVESAAKQSSDAPALLTFTEWSGTQPITADAYANTSNLNALLGADADPANDEDETAIKLDFLVLNTSAEIVAQSQAIAVTVENTITQAGESGPELAPLSARLIENLGAVTSLTGGGDTKLDGRATLTLPENWRVMLGYSGGVHFYELKFGTEAESSPDMIRPDDYDADTNAKYWQRLDIGADNVASFLDLVGVPGDNVALAALLSTYALLASPAFSGNPTAPTQALGNNSTRLANTAFVTAALAALVDASPGALDTLKEFATAVANDPDFANTITALIATKVAQTLTLSGGGLVTGGGTLAANRTFTVTPASQSEAEGGTSNTVALTPLSFAQALAKLGTLNAGYFTAYTGGGVGTLDGIVTAGRLDVGHVLFTAIGGDFARWQLKAWDGVEADDSAAGRVHPDDINASTNAKIWVRI